MISVTDEAKEYLESVLQDENATLLRIYLSAG